MSASSLCRPMAEMSCVSWSNNIHRAAFLSAPCKVLLILSSSSWRHSESCVKHFLSYEPSYEKKDFIIVRKVILQTHMRSHQVGPDLQLFVCSFLLFHILCKRTEKALVSAPMRKLAWAFVVRLCYKYPFVMSCSYIAHVMTWSQIWLSYSVQ